MYVLMTDYVIECIVSAHSAWTGEWPLHYKFQPPKPEESPKYRMLYE